MSVTGKECTEDITEEFYGRVKPFRDLSSEWKRRRSILHA
jgi:hypothetical protein